MQSLRYIQVAALALASVVAVESRVLAQRPGHGSSGGSESRGSSGGGSSAPSHSSGPSQSSAPSRPSAPPPSRSEPTYTPPSRSAPTYTPPPQRSAPTPPRNDSEPTRGVRSAPTNSGGSSEAGRPVRYTSPRTDEGARSDGPSSLRQRTAPVVDDSERGSRERRDTSRDDSIPVIRSAPRSPLSNVTIPTHTALPRFEDGLSARRSGRTAPTETRADESRRTDMTRADDARRNARRGIELPPSAVDRSSILERYKNAREESNRAQRGTTADSGPSKRIHNAREDATDSREAATAKRVHNARELERDRVGHADEKRIRNARDLALERTRSLRELAYRYPDRARNFERAGRGLSGATTVALNCGIGHSMCGLWGGWWFGNCWGFGFDDCNWNWCWWWNGCHPWSHWCWWNHPCNFGCWYFWGWAPYGYDYWYYPPPYYGPTYYTTVVEHYYDQPAATQSTTTNEQAPSANASNDSVGEGVLAETRSRAKTSTSDQALLDSLLVPGAASEAANAANEFLALGDNAFNEHRYGDAVHFYAKAVEFSPNNGTYYMILADSLFAAGDYHYAAYALRKALELAPTLAADTFDKHTIYKNDPTEFDRQLAVLELYLQDQPTDQDARLVLAANYLYGGRPAAAVDLLDQNAGAKLRDDPAGKLIYEAAKVAQFGKPADAPKSDGK